MFLGEPTASETTDELTDDALGAAPDTQLADAAPDPVRAAVSYGRAPSSAESLS
jgi:hypothetical protein